MRALLLLLLVACGGNTDGMCQVDGDCGGGEICARSEECLAPADIRMVKVNWTIRGMAAGAQTCSASPDLYIQFDGRSLDDNLAFEPVPCVAGQFFVDKLPKRFDEVELGVQGNVHDLTIIDPVAGTATFNLNP